MEYVYAALLLHKLGKRVDEKSLTSVVKAAGAEPDQAKIKALASALSEVNIDEALKSASSTVVAQAPAVTVPSQPTPAGKTEDKPKEEEKKEEEALAGLASLFG